MFFKAELRMSVYITTDGSQLRGGGVDVVKHGGTKGRIFKHYRLQIRMTLVASGVTLCSISNERKPVIQSVDKSATRLL